MFVELDSVFRRFVTVCSESIGSPPGHPLIPELRPRKSDLGANKKPATILNQTLFPLLPPKFSVQDCHALVSDIYSDHEGSSG